MGKDRARCSQDTNPRAGYNFIGAAAVEFLIGAATALETDETVRGEFFLARDPHRAFRFDVSRSHHVSH